MYIIFKNKFYNFYKNILFLNINILINWVKKRKTKYMKATVFQTTRYFQIIKK